LTFEKGEQENSRDIAKDIAHEEASAAKRKPLKRETLKKIQTFSGTKDQRSNGLLSKRPEESPQPSNPESSKGGRKNQASPVK